VSSRRSTPIPPSIPRALLAWYRRHRRPLPWRRDRDPYHVWVAEVLLQQTRVEQARPYFERFVAKFPTVGALARANPSEVLKAWQGAGYYARARHLHRAAERLVAERAGRLPDTVGELEALPGVGPYIARAVASLAFGRRVVALEANGLRVAARWTREEGPIGSATVRARLLAALEEVLPPDEPGAFNEALMELGETVCLPRRPRCDVCPVARACRARRELSNPGELPRRARRPPRPLLRVAVVALERKGRWLVQRRPPEGLLGGLWEFPGGKIGRRESPEAAARRELGEETGLTAGPLEEVGRVRHGYSHFEVDLSVFRGSAAVRVARAPPGERRWVRLDELERLPIPKATEKVLRLLTTAPSRRASRGSGSRRGRTSPSTPEGAERPGPRSRARGTAS